MLSTKGIHGHCLVFALLLVGCGGGGGGDEGGSTAADFQSVESFLAHSRVQRLLTRANLTVHTGSSPPNVEGIYDVMQTIELHDVQPGEVGQTKSFDLTLFDQAGEDIRVRDDSPITAAERAFITGTGNDFTIWRVVTLDFFLVDCRAVQVQVLTGRVLPNGDLEARLGEVLVGWLGTECSVLGDPAPLGSMIVSSIDGS